MGVLHPLFLFLTQFQISMKKIIFILCILASFMSGFAFKAVTETKSDDMKRVTGIGGIFFKSKDPKKMREWYKDHLGLATNE